MPFCSQAVIASVRSSSSLSSLPASSSISSGRASRTVSVRLLALAAADRLEHLPQLLAHLLHARWRHDVDADVDRQVRVRSCGPRAHPRGTACAASGGCRRRRHGSPLFQPAPAGRGSSASRTRSSARSSAWLRTCALACSRTSLYGDVGEIADDRLDVLADVADLGELGRLDLEEGRVGQRRQASRDLGLADAGRADHQDVLGRDLVAQRRHPAACAASGCAARSRRRAWLRAGR